MAPLPQLVTEIKMSHDDETPKNTMALWWKKSFRGILSEFLSTLMLVLFGCMSNIPMEGIDPTIYVPFAFGFIVHFNTQIFGHFSGAYMNPTVTLASVIWGKNSVTVGIAYVIAEFAGALVGYGMLTNMCPVNMVAERVCVPIPHASINGFQAVGIEMALTAALIFLNCGIWDPLNANKQDSAPIKFGLTVIGLGLAGGPLTGASLNPARTFATAVWTGYWAYHYVYWVGPCLGSLAAVMFYKYVLLNKRASD